LLDAVLVVGVLLCQIFISEASSLSKLAHPLSEISRLEERGVRANPLVISGERRVKVGELNHVGSVSACSSFSSVSVGVSVASSPLEVDVISLSSSEEGWDKVVLGGGVSLDDVSSLSSDVQVENSLEEGDGGRSWSDVEDVRSVLEGSSELSGIDGHGHVQTILSLGGILGDGRVGSISGPINESSIWSVSSRSSIGGGNVVSQSENAVAVIVADATLLSSEGDGPVEAGGESIDAVSEVVISGPSGLDTDGSGNIPWRNLNPVVLVTLASIFVVLFSRSSVLLLAFESALHVLRFLLVETAP